MFFMTFLFQEGRGLVEFSKVSELTSSVADVNLLSPSVWTFSYWGGRAETCMGVLGTVTEEVAEEVWKLLLTHCPCLRPGGGAASEAWALA